MSLVYNWAFAAGVITAAVYVGLLRLLDSRRAQLLYAAGLLSAALIYVGFALLNHGTAHMDLELSGLLIFGLVSVLTARRWPFILGVGWIAHGGWDFWHSAHPAAYVPSWWPAFCAAIDWVVGICILAIYARGKSVVTAPAKHL